MKTEKLIDKGIVGMSAYLFASALIIAVCNLPSFNKYNAMLEENESGSSFYDHGAAGSRHYMSDKHLANNDKPGEQTLTIEPFSNE